MANTEIKDLAENRQITAETKKVEIKSTGKGGEEKLQIFNSPYGKVRAKNRIEAEKKIIELKNKLNKK